MLPCTEMGAEEAGARVWSSGQTLHSSPLHTHTRTDHRAPGEAAADFCGISGVNPSLS